MAFDDLSNSEKESYNQGLKDEYSRLMNDYQRREFREQLRDTFQVSDRILAAIRECDRACMKILIDPTL